MVIVVQFVLSTHGGPIMNKKAPKKAQKHPLFKPLRVRKNNITLKKKPRKYLDSGASAPNDTREAHLGHRT